MLHKNPSQISLRGIFRVECDKKCITANDTITILVTYILVMFFVAFQPPETFV